MSFPIQFIDEPDDINNSDFNDYIEGDYPNEKDDEYWVKGELRKDCPNCGGTGCGYCYGGYIIIKKP